MKISLFSAFYPFRGGIAQFNERFCQELEKNHEVKKFTFKTQYPSFLFPGKTQFSEPSAKPKTGIAKRIVSTFNPFSYNSGAKRIVQSNPDIFIANYWMTFFGPFLGWFGTKMNKKAKRVALVHNLVPHEKRFFDTFFSKYFVKNYDGFVVLSEAVKKDILQLKPTAKILQIEHPLYDHFGDKTDKSQAISNLGLDSTKKTLLFFGIIRDYKGLDLLIEAMLLLSDDYQLIIVGEVYGDSKKYEVQIENSSRRDDILMINKFVDDKDVNQYFSVADLCVLPYRSATQSGVTAISHYFEVPVLATNVGGLKETISHKKTGYIIEQSNPKLIAAGIMDFFASTSQIDLVSNIQILKRERSWKSFSNQVIEFSQSL